MKMILDIVDAAQTKVHYRLIFFLPTFTQRQKETPFPTTQPSPFAAMPPLLNSLLAIRNVAPCSFEEYRQL